MSTLRSNGSFVRLVGGRLVTNAGDSAYTIAAIWLAWELTGSATFSGIAGFLVFATQPLQFLVGPLVDRWPLRRVLVGTQLIQAVGVAVVPAAAAVGALNVWIILVVIPVLGMVNQFVYPAQSAALPRIVEEENLVRANSLISLAYEGVDIVFNALSGVIIATIGAVSLYVFDSVTFLIATALFAGIVVPDEEDSPDDEASEAPADGEADETPTDDADAAEEDRSLDWSGYVADLREGVDYLWGSVLVDIILGATVVNFVFGMMMAVLPAFADGVGGPQFYGFLMAVLAAGTLVGAVAASAVENAPVGVVYAVGFVVAGASLGSVAVVSNRWLILGLFFGAFFPPGIAQVLSSSVLQSAVDETILARVTSVQTSVSTSMMPLGSLAGGFVADATSPSAALLGLGGLLVLVGGYLAVRPRIRSLPAVADVDEERLDLGVSSPDSDASMD